MAMVSHGDFSPEARDRARRTVHAAGIFADHAEVIVAEFPELPETHLLVAVVTGGLEYSGTFGVDALELVARVPELERDGWAMVFRRDSSAEDVRRRALEMASIATQRAAAIERIAARRADS
jgi:hypothetical protein